jgi:hypothetical protein
MNPRLATVLALIVAAALFRLVPHAWNVTPIAAMALFAGAHLQDRRLAFAIPLGAMLLSDLVLGLHWTMVFVYAAFALTVLMGMGLRGRPAPLSVLGAALASSVAFFLITNFGAWLGHGMYPQTLEGLAAAYAAGVPFFRNTLTGDLAFTALLFGGFALAQRHLPWLAEPSAR